MSMSLHPTDATGSARLPASTLMYREAAEAPAVVDRQLTENDAAMASLAARLRAQPPRFVVTCARGSSDHAATFAKYLIETQLGLVTASASPSVSSLYRAPQDLAGVLYIVISQSGRSSDLLHCAEAARFAGAQVLALVNREDSPLAAIADTVIPLMAGAEHSVPATKSFLATLASLLQLVSHWNPDPLLRAALPALPEAMQEAFTQDWTPLVQGLTHVQDLFVLGRGLGLGVAQEAALKLKETCGLHAEALSSAEVKHGPMALVKEGFPLLLFAQDDATLRGSLAAAREFRGRGARVWSAAPQDAHADALPLTSTPHFLCEPLLAAQSFYRAANALSLARGHDPDSPPHLRKVTETL